MLFRSHSLNAMERATQRRKSESLVVLGLAHLRAAQPLGPSQSAVPLYMLEFLNHFGQHPRASLAVAVAASASASASSAAAASPSSSLVSRGPVPPRVERSVSSLCGKKKKKKQKKKTKKAERDDEDDDGASQDKDEEEEEEEEDDQVQQEGGLVVHPSSSDAAGSSLLLAEEEEEEEDGEDLEDGGEHAALATGRGKSSRRRAHKGETKQAICAFVSQNPEHPHGHRLQAEFLLRHEADNVSEIAAALFSLLRVDPLSPFALRELLRLRSGHPHAVDVFRLVNACLSRVDLAAADVLEWRTLLWSLRAAWSAYLSEDHPSSLYPPSVRWARWRDALDFCARREEWWCKSIAHFGLDTSDAAAASSSASASSSSSPSPPPPPPPPQQQCAPPITARAPSPFSLSSHAQTVRPSPSRSSPFSSPLRASTTTAAPPTLSDRNLTRSSSAHSPPHPPHSYSHSHSHSHSHSQSAPPPSPAFAFRGTCSSGGAAASEESSDELLLCRSLCSLYLLRRTCPFFCDTVSRFRARVKTAPALIRALRKEREQLLLDIRNG